MCLGIPARVVSITDGGAKLAMVEIGGARREVNLACVLDEDQQPESLIGTWVLIHVGFAMSRLDEREAAATLDVLQELGEMESELEAVRRDGRD